MRFKKIFKISISLLFSYKSLAQIERALENGRIVNKEPFGSTYESTLRKVPVRIITCDTRDAPNSINNPSYVKKYSNWIESARRLGGVSHPSLVGPLGASQDEKGVMRVLVFPRGEKEEGEEEGEKSVGEVIKRMGREERVGVMVDVGGAIAFIHGRGKEGGKGGGEGIAHGWVGSERVVVERGGRGGKGKLRDYGVGCCWEGLVCFFICFCFC